MYLPQVANMEKVDVYTVYFSYKIIATISEEKFSNIGIP